jgi:hypothetical protein
VGVVGVAVGDAVVVVLVGVRLVVVVFDVSHRLPISSFGRPRTRL